MNEDSIFSAEGVAYETICKMRHMQEETLKLNNTLALVNEIAYIREEIGVKEAQIASVDQQIDYIGQVSDTLSAAIGALSTPATVPLSEKTLLTVKEATAHTGVGQNRLRRIGKSKIGDIALWDGNKLMFNREKLDRYLSKSYSI